MSVYSIKTVHAYTWKETTLLNVYSMYNPSTLVCWEIFQCLPRVTQFLCFSLAKMLFSTETKPKPGICHVSSTAQLYPVSIVRSFGWNHPSTLQHLQKGAINSFAFKMCWCEIAVYSACVGFFFFLVHDDGSQRMFYIS